MAFSITHRLLPHVCDAWLNKNKTGSSKYLSSVLMQLNNVGTVFENNGLL